jgi:hypothetical protein
MHNKPVSDTADPNELDNGELFRPSLRQLPTGQLKPTERRFIFGLLAVTALGLAVFALAR